MRILIVGSKANATRSELSESSIFSTEDVLDVHTVPEGTPPYDMVIGDNCVRVYPNTIQFLRPFVKKAEEAAAAKAKASGEPAPEKPKKKATKKKVETTEMKIVLPDSPGKEEKGYEVPGTSTTLTDAALAHVNKAMSEMVNAPNKMIADQLKSGKGVSVWDIPNFIVAVETEPK